VTLVEFALMAPLGLIFLLGTLIGGIFAMNYVQLSNAVRDGVRAAAVCGGSGRTQQSQIPTSQIPTLPDGSACTDLNLIAYIKGRFQAIPGNKASLQVTLPTGGTGDHLSQCQYRKTVEIKASYDQPIYLPLISNILSNNGSGSTYTITAQAEATCEQ
jgi:Flp pilus assembly protein TadG